MGVIVGTWHFDKARGDLPDGALSAIAAMGRRLQTATGLRVELQPGGRTLRIPTLREELFSWGFYDRGVSVEDLTAQELEELFDWAAGDHAATVHSFIPAHPYLWENLDAVMTAAGGRRANLAVGWQPNPAHARLRTRWDNLSPRDRFLLAMPSLWAARPLDRLL
jgi:hypothetical protein